MKVRYGLLALLLLLSGCSDGPSAGDIKAAIQRAAPLLMGASMVTIEDVSNVDCKEAQGKPGYVCSYTVTAFILALKQRITNVFEGRFVKTENGWNLMQS
jgi:hypothetical protein